jgi:hypothetical protein
VFSWTIIKLDLVVHNSLTQQAPVPMGQKFEMKNSGGALSPRDHSKKSVALDKVKFVVNLFLFMKW